MKDSSSLQYRLYGLIWLILLGLTLLMVGLEKVNFAYATLALILIVAMLAKAFLIVSFYMHLRLERTIFMVFILLGLLGLAVILFFFILPDGVRVHELSKL